MDPVFSLSANPSLPKKGGSPRQYNSDPEEERECPVKESHAGCLTSPSWRERLSPHYVNRSDEEGDDWSNIKGLLLLNGLFRDDEKEVDLFLEDCRVSEISFGLVAEHARLYQSVYTKKQKQKPDSVKRLKSKLVFEWGGFNQSVKLEVFAACIRNFRRNQMSRGKAKKEKLDQNFKKNLKERKNVMKKGFKPSANGLLQTAMVNDIQRLMGEKDGLKELLHDSKEKELPELEIKCEWWKSMIKFMCHRSYFSLDNYFLDLCAAVRNNDWPIHYDNVNPSVVVGLSALRYCMQHVPRHRPEFVLAPCQFVTSAGCYFFSEYYEDDDYMLLHDYFVVDACTEYAVWQLDETIEFECPRSQDCCCDCQERKRGWLPSRFSVEKVKFTLTGRILAHLEDNEEVWLRVDNCLLERIAGYRAFSEGNYAALVHSVLKDEKEKPTYARVRQEIVWDTCLFALFRANRHHHKRLLYVDQDAGEKQRFLSVLSSVKVLGNILPTDTLSAKFECAFDSIDNYLSVQLADYESPFLDKAAELLQRKWVSFTDAVFSRDVVQPMLEDGAGLSDDEIDVICHVSGVLKPLYWKVSVGECCADYWNPPGDNVRMVFYYTGIQGCDVPEKVQSFIAAGHYDVCFELLGGMGFNEFMSASWSFLTDVSLLRLFDRITFPMDLPFFSSEQNLMKDFLIVTYANSQFFFSNLDIGLTIPEVLSARMRSNMFLLEAEDLSKIDWEFYCHKGIQELGWGMLQSNTPMIHGVATAFQRDDVILRAGDSLHMDYDPRISVDWIDQSDCSVGNASEVWYKVLIHKGHVYGQNLTREVALYRFGKSLKYKPNASFRKLYVLYFSRCVFPQVMDYDNGFVPRDEFSVYLENMPTASRKRHLEAYDDYNLATGVFVDRYKHDQSFTKMDEMLFNLKGRIICNSPPSLFRQLVAMCHAVKKAWKTSHLGPGDVPFIPIFSHNGFIVYFTYGADLDIRQKAWWRRFVADRLMEQVDFVCVLVGGDDNLCIGRLWGEVFCLESDVTACDQSHNIMVLEMTLEMFQLMGVLEEDLNVLRESYYRPVCVKGKMKIHFNEPQLHTGHPHTSVCNTAAVGMIVVLSFIHSRFTCFSGKKRSPPSIALKDMSEKFGMDWKIMDLDVEDGTFHKGYWVPANNDIGFVWCPLPSCVWKMTKLRVNAKIGLEEINNRFAMMAWSRSLDCLPPLARAYVTAVLEDYVEQKGQNAFEKLKKNQLEQIKDGSWRRIGENYYSDLTDGALGAHLEFASRRYGDTLEGLDQMFSNFSYESWYVFNDRRLTHMIERDYGDHGLSLEDEVVTRWL